MERIIKFRAWSKELNKMFLQSKHFFSIAESSWGVYTTTDDVAIDGSSYVDKNRSAILMQYTGLKDSSGKEIFEGDIIYWKHLGKESAVEVYFNQKEFVFVGKPIDKADKTESWLDNKCTYLGNKFEHPNLIKN